MNKEDIQRFFEPKSIAVIGASENTGKVGNDLMLKLENFKGEVIPINPQNKEILGKKVYASVLDYKKEIELAIIAIPAQLVNKVLEECGKKKIKNVIIISAGFSEIGNNQAEEELKKTAEKYSINFIGPNCFGITNPAINLDVTFANKSTISGETALISQSGALWSYIADLGIGISKFVSLGNMAKLSFVDFLEYFIQDEKTKKIILYIERLKQGKRFIEICRNSKKPILVVKSGKSKQGLKATISHTGSLATDYRVYSGIFNQAKIKQFQLITEALNMKSDLPKLIETIKQIKNPEISIITNAGGAGALITDNLELNGISVKEAPLDVIGTALALDYKNAIENSNSNVIIVIFTPQTMSQAKETAEAIIELSKKDKSKQIIPCFLGEASIKEAMSLFKKNKIPCFTRCV